MNKIEFYLPKKKIANADILKEFPIWDYKTFEEKVGIKQRYIVSEQETALDLAYKASIKCLNDFDKKRIDFIILCTQSPEYILPTTACILQDMLKVKKECGAFDFNLGCSGYIYGLSIAKGFLIADIASNILFVVSETYSKYIHPLDRTNKTIFGDAAAATIITKNDIDRIGEFVLHTDGSGYDKLIVKNGGSNSPYDPLAKEKSYGDDNRYTDNHLYMNGPDIFSFTLENIPKLIDDVLAKNKINKDDVDYFIFHQANAFMLQMLRKRIKIPKDKFYIDISETGNTVSATIPIALKKALDEGKVQKGNKVLLAGFGVGLSWGATIIEI